MVDRTRRRGGLVGRLLGSPSPAVDPRPSGPAPVAAPSVDPPQSTPAPVAAPPADPRPSTPAPVSVPSAAQDPAVWLPADAAPDPTLDEPAPVSSEPEEPSDPNVARWLPDEAPAVAVVAARAPAEPEHSQWLPERTVAGGGRREAGVALATVDPQQLSRSVGAYCNELLDTRLTPEATETILSRFHAASEQSHATIDELLRLTRKTTADYALAPNAWRGAAAAARREECRATPARLAARDANTLPPAARAELESHLDHCLSCQAIELRCKRAERAFTTTLATTVLDGDTDATGTEPLGAAAHASGSRGAAMRRITVLAGAGLLLAACAAVALVLVGGGSHPQPTTAVPASATSVPTAGGSRYSTHRATAARRHVTRHPGRRHHPAKHSKPRSGGGGASAAVSSAPTGSSAAATAPASAAAPSAPAPTSAPAASSGSSGAGGSSGSTGGSSSSPGPVSVTQQGSSLPAQSAPTQGISSGGSAGSQH